MCNCYTLIAAEIEHRSVRAVGTVRTKYCVPGKGQLKEQARFVVSRSLTLPRGADSTLSRTRYLTIFPSKICPSKKKRLANVTENGQEGLKLKPNNNVFNSSIIAITDRTSLCLSLLCEKEWGQ